MKRCFFQAVVVSILLYGCTTWKLEKKLDGNYTRMLRAILNKSWRQHPTRHQLYGHLPPITKTIQARRTRYVGHCWMIRDELKSDVLPWTPTYGRAKAGRPTRTYIQQLCEDTGCSPEDLRRCVVFWPSTRPKSAIPGWCTGGRWHIPMASNRKRSCGRIKAYNIGQGEGPSVPLQWCTRGEWPVDCVTVISAWWRLNIRFQRSSGWSCGRWIII